jgi:hypothetical protein
MAGSKLKRLGKNKNRAVFYNSDKWKYGSPNSIVFGYIIAEDLQLDTAINPAEDVKSKVYSKK